MWQVTLVSLLILPYFEEDVCFSLFHCQNGHGVLIQRRGSLALDFSPHGFTFISLIFVDTT